VPSGQKDNEPSSAPHDEMLPDYSHAVLGMSRHTITKADHWQATYVAYLFIIIAIYYIKPNNLFKFSNGM